MAITILLVANACTAQTKNATTETVKIYGNCSMCKNTIEQAGNIKKVANIDWNENSKMATITYDATKTNMAEILKRVALAGYDSDEFLAPDDVYAKLPDCCQYVRGNKTVSNTLATETDTTIHTQHSTKDNEVAPKVDHKNHSMGTKAEISLLENIYSKYFILKDALVKSDGNLASSKAVELVASIKSIDMKKLTSEEHTVWMKVMKDLLMDAENIEKTKDVVRQRGHFASLSENLYKLIKVSKSTTVTYYQFCPMYNNGKGANWLSKESTIKNPYFGAQMLACGNTVETIK